MPSPAANKYRLAATGVDIVLKSVRSRPRAQFTRDELQNIFSASFIIIVATWNSYIINIINDFFIEAADPLIPKYNAMHSVTKQHSERLINRFNTPNAENTHNILLQSIGYDPWNNWEWRKTKMDGRAVRTRLDEIMMVRHSIAHGFQMPLYNWNKSNTGKARLTVKNIKWNQAFIMNLVIKTDAGVRNHLKLHYGKTTNW